MAKIQEGSKGKEGKQIKVPQSDQREPVVARRANRVHACLSVIVAPCLCVDVRRQFLCLVSVVTPIERAGRSQLEARMTAEGAAGPSAASHVRSSGAAVQSALKVSKAR